MTKIELLEHLLVVAKEFRKDIGHYSRNSHMHEITEAPDQKVIDAVLVGFINSVGVFQGVDYALYTKDLMEK